MIEKLSRWIDGQGDLFTVRNSILRLGPLLATVLVLMRAERSGLAIAWIGFAALVVAVAIYYVAFFVALKRQRERFYQREVKPLLSSEYKDG